MAREYQRSKVYKWEYATIPNGRRLSFKEAQEYVAMVFEGEGLKYPPLIKKLPKQTRRWAGMGHRNAIWVPETGTNEHVVLHELAHTLTMTIHGASVVNDTAHGPDFVGMFMHLVSKYMSMPLFMLWYSAQQAGIEFEKFPTPKINDVA